MNDYILPAPLQERLDLMRKHSPEALMQANIPAPAAMLLTSLINSEIPSGQLAMGLLVSLATILAISLGQSEDYGVQSELETTSGMKFSQEDILQFHFALLRHLTDHMLAHVKAKHMDMKATTKPPERMM